MKALAILLALNLPSSALSADAAPYNANETLRRAHVGVYSPRLAEPVPVRVVSSSPMGKETFDTLDCEPDPADPEKLICEAETKR